MRLLVFTVIAVIIGFSSGSYWKEQRIESEIEGAAASIELFCKQQAVYNAQYGLALDIAVIERIAESDNTPLWHELDKLLRNRLIERVKTLESTNGALERLDEIEALNKTLNNAKDLINENP